MRAGLVHARYVCLLASCRCTCSLTQVLGPAYRGLALVVALDYDPSAVAPTTAHHIRVIMADSPKKKGATVTAWNEAATAMLEDALRTQQSIAEALSQHDKDASEMDNLKQECDAEIEDLQEEAWRLAMYTELERMRLQLAMLTPLEGEGGEEGSSQPGSPNKAAGSSGAAGQGEEEGEQLTLDQLDSEIANVDAELRAAKAELLDMMSHKAALQEDMASILSAATAGEAAEIEAAAAATAAQQVPTSPGKQAAAAAAAAAAAGEDRDHTGKAVDQKSKAVSEDQLRTAVKQLSATTAAAMKA